MTKYHLGDVAFEDRSTWRQSTENVPVVGLEHLLSGDILLKRWATNVSDSTFTKRFKKGQILLGRRRVYLRKAVVAPFDGICSGDITVIEAKKDKLCPDLFPYIIQNGKFFDYAMQGSAGSLSPRVKWSHLAEYEFSLPSIEDQRRLADLLWAANDLKEAYRQAIMASDEMLNAKFREMFCMTENVPLQQVADVIMGASPNSDSYNTTGDGMPFYQGKTEFGTKWIGAPLTYCTNPVKIAEIGDILMSVRAPVGSVNITNLRCCIGRGLAAIRPRTEVTTQSFLFHALRLQEKEIESLGTGSTFKAINKEAVLNIPVPYGDLKLQEHFSKIAEMAECASMHLYEAHLAISTSIENITNQALEV